MFKYSSNPIFWTVAAVMLVTLADLTQVSGIQALNVLAAYFLIWWGFYLYRKSLARRWDLMLPCPDGVCVTGPGRLQAVPCLYALAQCLFSLVCLTLVQEWTVFVLVLVISLAGALITMNAVRRTGGQEARYRQTMRKTLRICFLVLALLLTIFGWNESRAGVFLVWALLCVEELVSLQMQENRSPVPWYHWYKPLLLAGAVVFVACALWLVFAG